MAKATLLLELDKEQIGVLRRALEASVCDMQLRLWAAIPVMKAFNAKRGSQRSLCGRSRVWNDRLTTVLGVFLEPESLPEEDGQ
jgi:hypothetical protein